MTSTAMIEGGFATVVEAAEFLRLSRAKVYQLMDQRELAYAKFGKSRRIPRRALNEYAERCVVGAVSTTPPSKITNGQ
jgi:excisionase family DNA binding protein